MDIHGQYTYKFFGPWLITKSIYGQLAASQKVEREIRQQYSHIQRIWPIYMAGECISYETFASEPYSERRRFYIWVCKQAGEFADLI